MRKLTRFGAGATFLLISSGFASAQLDPNPAMNDPDKQAWDLFFTVNEVAAANGNNDAFFETWASDGDTFQTNPAWPAQHRPVSLGTRALSFVAAQSLRSSKARGPFRPSVVPNPGSDLVSEETRRNKPDFDFIVQNGLFRVSGLMAAYVADKPLTFPKDSIEVKANWVAVSRLHEFNGFSGSPADAAKLYHVNTASDGKQYALVAFHIISKLVPNWTWATFEHKDNPGRCDVVGCADSFGATVAYVAPASQTESDHHYADCDKTASLQAMFKAAKIDPAFQNYCLKGSQSDFTDTSGLAVRLGNSVTENSFVAQASCMTCHGRAAFDSTGHPTTFAGFSPIGLGINQRVSSNTGSAPVGPLQPQWYWTAPTSMPTNFPGLVGETGITRTGFPADFVWSVPFCAIDDTVTPKETKSRYCANK